MDLIVMLLLVILKEREIGGGETKMHNAAKNIESQRLLLLLDKRLKPESYEQKP